jgi:hypothetical protein
MTNSSCWSATDRYSSTATVVRVGSSGCWPLLLSRLSRRLNEMKSRTSLSSSKDAVRYLGSSQCKFVLGLEKKNPTANRILEVTSMSVLLGETKLREFGFNARLMATPDLPPILHSATVARDLLRNVNEAFCSQSHKVQVSPTKRAAGNQFLAQFLDLFEIRRC